jgi:PAS domain S-box-containing protein
MATGPLTDALRETLALFDENGPPMTTNEVAERLDLGRRSTYERLERLVERDDLRTKKVGANARVWWRTAATPGTSAADGDSEVGGEQLALLVDAVEDYAIFMLDVDGRVRSWNPGAERIKGYVREEIVGRHFSAFYTEGDRENSVPENNLADAAANGVVTDEGWRVRADGSRFWAHVTITAIYDEDGRLTGYAKVTRDMTDRREREQAISRGRNLLDQVLETSPIGIGVFRPDGSVDRVNARMGELLWLSEEDAEAYELGDLDLYGPSGDLLAFDESPVGRVLETGDPVTDQEVRIEDEKHGARWLSVDAAPLTDGDGGLERVVSTVADVTQHKVQAQQLERQRDELVSELREMYERVDDAFYALDEEFRFTYVNDRAEELLRREEGELLGESVWAVFPEAEETPAWESFHRSLKEQVSTSFEVYFEPLEFWVEANVYPSETGLSVYFRDVTERKDRERELERYETIVETMVDGVFVTDGDGKYAMVNDAYVEMTGYSRDELIGSDTSLVIGEENVEEGREMIEEILEGEREVGVWGLTQERADGGTNLVESRFTLLPNDGEYRGSVGVIRDISERKDRERELERYERIVETVYDGVYLVNPDGEFTMVNEAYARMTGYDREELVGMSVGELVDEETVERALGYEEEMVEGERETARFEADAVRADGDTFRAEGVFSIIEGADGDHERVGVVRDITERKERERQLEARVAQQEAVTALGRRALQGPDLDELMAEAAEAVAETLDNDY